MKHLIICLLISVSVSAQKFDDFFFTSGINPDSSVTIYPKTWGVFIADKDTILICPIIVYYPSGQDSGVNIHGFWIYAPSYPDNIIIDMRDKKDVVLIKSKENEEGSEDYTGIYTVSNLKKEDFSGFIDGIVIGKKFNPVGKSKSYLINHVGGFNSIKMNWYE